MSCPSLYQIGYTFGKFIKQIHNQKETKVITLDVNADYNADGIQQPTSNISNALASFSKYYDSKLQILTSNDFFPGSLTIQNQMFGYVESISSPATLVFRLTSDSQRVESFVFNQCGIIYFKNVNFRVPEEVSPQSTDYSFIPFKANMLQILIFESCTFTYEGSSPYFNWFHLNATNMYLIGCEFKANVNHTIAISPMLASGLFDYGCNLDSLTLKGSGNWISSEVVS